MNATKRIEENTKDSIRFLVRMALDNRKAATLATLDTMRNWYQGRQGAYLIAAKHIAQSMLS